MNQGINHIRGTQDWQIDAYEMQSKHNSLVRHQRTVSEMERHTSTWGVNMSERKER